MSGGQGVSEVHAAVVGLGLFSCGCQLPSTASCATALHRTAGSGGVAVFVWIWVFAARNCLGLGVCVTGWVAEPALIDACSACSAAVCRSSRTHMRKQRVQSCLCKGTHPRWRQCVCCVLGCGCGHLTALGQRDPPKQ